MSNLLSIPMQDDFETNLAQSWNGSNNTIYVNAVPTATTPSGSNFSYIVVDPGKSTMQVRKVTAWENVGNTFTATTATIKKGSGLSYSAVSHAAGSVVRFSNNYQFWEDIQTAINTKLDNDGDNETTTWNLSVAGSNFRFRKDANDMKFRDDNQSEVTLSQLAAAAGTDHKFLNSVTDTTASYLSTKLTAGDGLTATTINPAGNETTDLDIDVTDTNIFVQTSSGASESGKIPRLNANGVVDISMLDIKGKTDVKAMALVNITISNPGTSTFDSYSASNGDRILLPNQTAGAENGIYIFNGSSSAMTRAIDFNANISNEVILGANVWVQGGTVGAGTQWTLSTTGAITVGTTAIAFAQTYPATNYISSVALTTPLTVPAACNVILIEATAADGAGRTQKGDIILTRIGKTTGSIQGAETNGVNNTPGALCSWSGSTLTTTLTGTTLGGNVYYYKSL